MKSFTVRRGKKGFTLLELLIVIVVLAVLAGLAVPQYIRTVARTKEGEGWQNMATLRSALLRYYAEQETILAQADWGDLDIQDPNAITDRYFTYDVLGVVGSTFTLEGDPGVPAGNKIGQTSGVRTLTLDDLGNRTETP